MNPEQIKREQERVNKLLEGIGTWITADTGRPFGGDCAVITAENSPYDGHAEICECGDPEEAAFIAAAPDIARQYAALLAAHAEALERDRLREATEKWATIARLAQYAPGDPVKKKSGGAWRGYVVGYYSASLTPIGYAVESHFEPGSVQIYPAKALERWEANHE